MAKMTIAGVGYEFTILSVIYGLTIFFVNYAYFPNLTFTLGFKIVNILIGSLFIILGFTLIRKSLIIVQYFHDRKLCTEGIYSKVQHPIYLAWIFIIIPGVVIIIGSLLSFTIPIFMYFLFLIFIPREEKYLEQMFGEDYLRYKNSTGRIFPQIINKKK
ncbi:MAG: methyltransferase family protein [Promethearchaeota archaeon]